MIAKKMLIYQLVEKQNGSMATRMLRSINVHSEFIGINKDTGVINFSDFKNLAEDLEPGVPNKRIAVVDI